MLNHNEMVPLLGFVLSVDLDGICVFLSHFEFLSVAENLGILTSAYQGYCSD